MPNSATRAMRVASAAPWIPMAGAPRLPKISTQFRNTLTHREVRYTTTATRITAMLRSVAM